MHPDCKAFMEQMLRVLHAERNAETRRLDRFDMAISIQVDICGFAGCAIGAAAFDPWFRARGLHFRHEDAEGRPLNKHLIGAPQQVMFAGHCVDFELDFDDEGVIEESDAAITRAFSIPPEHFAELFGAETRDSDDRTYTRTLIEVIEAIEHYLAHGEPLPAALMES